ncbi:condensation domain-containing protein, partial [Streptomyces avidinii]
MRAALDDSAAGPAAPTDPAAVTAAVDGLDPAPVASFAQERMWLVDRMMDGTPGYAIPEVVRLRGPVRPDLLCRSLTAVVARHAPLRTVFAERDGAPHPVGLLDPAAV